MGQLIDNTFRFCTVVRAIKPNSLSVNSPIMKTENHFTNFTFRVQPREVCAPCIPGNMLYGSHSSLRTQYIIYRVIEYKDYRGGAVIIYEVIEYVYYKKTTEQ